MTTTWQWIKFLLTFVLLHLTAPSYFQSSRTLDNNCAVSHQLRIVIVCLNQKPVLIPKSIEECLQSGRDHKKMARNEVFPNFSILPFIHNMQIAAALKSSPGGQVMETAMFSN